MAGALELGGEFVVPAALDVLESVAAACLLVLDGLAGHATVDLVGLPVAAKIRGAAVFVLDVVCPFWMGGQGVRMCLVSTRQDNTG